MNESLFTDAAKRIAEHLGYCPHSTPEDEAAGAQVLSLVAENERLREALSLIVDIDPITDKHAPVQMRNAQRLAKEALRGD